MSEWSWVVFAYSVSYAALLGYVGILAWRIRTARRRLEEVS
jgi:hypothetical protein